MKLYNVWRTDGSIQTIKSEKELSLKVLQKLVGGYIEILDLGKTLFIVNEEGKLRGLPKNPAFPTLVGDVVTTGKEE